MTYELRQRLQLGDDYDADFLAEFFVEKTDLRLVYDTAGGDYLLLEFTDAPERHPDVPIIDKQQLLLDREIGVDKSQNPFTLDEDIDRSDISRSGTGGVAATQRLYQGDGGDE